MEPACLPVFPENPANFVSYENEAESDGYMPESSCSDTGYDESDLNGEDWAKIARNKDFTKQYNRQRRLFQLSKSGPDSLSGIPRGNFCVIEANSRNMSNFETMDIVNKYMSRLNLKDYLPCDDKVKISKDKSDRATTEQVLDLRTRIILFKLINKGIIYKINGCVSTGKEANVYHAITESGEQRAIKVYKTSILIFKNRDRYVSGEYRFRHNYSRHNPRKKVKLWAEKEMRNLKRLYQAGIPCPEPLYLRMHVLVMGFLGGNDSWPYPRLKDANISSNKYPDLYLQLLCYIRIIYQVCHLVHSDLSEYNILYHSKVLYIIDVSQSVEHNHPRSLEFLRMDISNVNDFFRKNGVTCFNAKAIFDFVISDSGGMTKEEIEKTLIEMQSLEEFQESIDFKEDIVFKYSYIPQTLKQVVNEEKDIELINNRNGSCLLYKRLINISSESKTDSDNESDYLDKTDSMLDDNFNKNEECGSNLLKLKKFEDKNAKKERKTQVKELNKERRKHKMHKAEKKQKIKASKKRKSK
ncbi:hypothetical protein MERGE_002995 [Pneumocystis wakefieldiae]|uniref:Serine/threonine-protein kinase RIO1 n=1 Tax=Pneumocystis wakefieldiae TaxID=38082 RepID=A0A899G0E9_9ASCO|nr:hypothetical protein MERGE_002995 [Pneumocystis wakefieldiae]